MSTNRVFEIADDLKFVEITYSFAKGRLKGV